MVYVVTESVRDTSLLSEYTSRLLSYLHFSIFHGANFDLLQ